VSVFALRFFLFEEENASLGYDSRVDYLQSTGVQVIDSTYRANGNSRFVLEMTGMPSPLHSEGFVFGYRSTHCAPDSFGLYQHCGKNHWKTPGWRYGTQIFTGSADTNAHHIQNRCIVSNDLSRIYVSQNGVATCINPDAPDDCGFTSSWNLAIFGAYYTSNRDTTGLVQTRIHSLSFYEGDTAQREFIPVLKDGVPGLWDNVNGQFYPKTAGSADFLYGERLTIRSARRRSSLRVSPGFVRSRMHCSTSPRAEWRSTALARFIPAATATTKSMSILPVRNRRKSFPRRHSSGKAGRTTSIRASIR